MLLGSTILLFLLLVRAQGTMKSKPGSGSVPNKHLHSRVSFLFQAATLLNKTRGKEPGKCKGSEIDELYIRNPELGSGISRQLISHLRGVSLKAQMRLAPSIKHAICKRCDTLLKDGSTLRTYVENKSHDRKKPWADVLVHECTQCGTIRRFPVGAKRQPRRQKRPAK